MESVLRAAGRSKPAPAKPWPQLRVPAASQRGAPRGLTASLRTCFTWKSETLSPNSSSLRSGEVESWSRHQVKTRDALLKTGMNRELWAPASSPGTPVTCMASPSSNPTDGAEPNSRRGPGLRGKASSALFLTLFPASNFSGDFPKTGERKAQGDLTDLEAGKMRGAACWDDRRRCFGHPCLCAWTIQIYFSIYSSIEKQILGFQQVCCS